MTPQEDSLYYNRTFQLWKDGNVKRYHTLATDSLQKTSAHSWGVAALCMDLFPDASLSMLKWCIAHDVPEAYTGDTPAHVKWVQPTLKEELNSLERMYYSSMNYPEVGYLSPIELIKVQLCDLLELCFYSYKEYRLESKMEFIPVLFRGISYIENNYLLPLRTSGVNTSNIENILEGLKKEPFPTR